MDKDNFHDPLYSFAEWRLWRCVEGQRLVTVVRRLTTGIRSEKFVVRRFRRCVNAYLHKPRQYNIAYYALGYMV